MASPKHANASGPDYITAGEVNVLDKTGRTVEKKGGHLRRRRQVDRRPDGDTRQDSVE